MLVNKLNYSIVTLLQGAIMQGIKEALPKVFELGF